MAWFAARNLTVTTFAGERFDTFAVANSSAVMSYRFGPGAVRPAWVPDDAQAAASAALRRRHSRVKQEGSAGANNGDNVATETRNGPECPARRCS